MLIVIIMKQLNNLKELKSQKKVTNKILSIGNILNLI